MSNILKTAKWTKLVVMRSHGLRWRATDGSRESEQHGILSPRWHFVETAKIGRAFVARRVEHWPPLLGSESPSGGCASHAYGGTCWLHC